MVKLKLLCALACVAGLVSSTVVHAAEAVSAPAGTNAKTAFFNPLDYGAVGDGHTNDTAAFARVMAAVQQAGGGTVWVPAGQFLTGSIQLVDNVTLHLDAGAELLYSGDPADSPVVSARFECTNVYSHAPLIYANGRHNIAITGRGTLNGQGWNWWWRAGSRRGAVAGKDPRPAYEAWRKLYTRIEAGEKLTAQDFSLAAEFLRPSLVGIYNSHNVLVDGVTLFKSPMWMLHPVYSEDIVIHGVRFVSADPDGHPSKEGTGPNGDGIDVDSCRNVRISDCFFSTSDDCIVIKSGRDNDGLRTNIPTEYVTITNCVMYKGHGAVVIGSETSGGIRDITASNIVSKGTDTGVRIKSMRGRGGLMENFRFDNWVIEDAQKTAFEITMRYGRTEPAPVSQKTPLFRNFSYSNITVVNAKKVATVEGLEERDVQELRFSDINATGQTGFIADHGNNIRLQNVRVAVQKGPAFSFDTAHDIVLDDVTAQTAAKDAPVVGVKDTADLTIRGSHAVEGTGNYLYVAGEKSANIHLVDTDLSAATSDVMLAQGVAQNVVSRK